MTSPESPMDLLAPIRDQMDAVALPLCAVTLTAVPSPDTPVLLMLHWHGFRADYIADAPAARPVALRSVATSALQLNDRWQAFATLELAVMEAGWELGAWDVSRRQRRGCLRPGAERSEARECLQAFGALPDALGGRELVVGDTPDADELHGLAGRAGYRVWTFRPIAGGLWRDVADDATLEADGSRTPTCPLLPEPLRDEGESITVYRFGRSASRVLH
jgi:hypothetical protein